MQTKLRNIIEDYFLIAVAVLVVVGVLGGAAYFGITRGTASERAAAELEDRGYTVVSTERKWVSLTCLQKDDAHVVVHVVKDGEEKDINTCVNIWRVKVRD